MVAGERTRQADLRGVERIPFAERTLSDELNDEPRPDEDEDDEHQANDDENRHGRLVWWNE